jgi:hypothetical protein
MTVEDAKHDRALAAVHWTVPRDLSDRRNGRMDLRVSKNSTLTSEDLTCRTIER